MRDTAFSVAPMRKGFLIRDDRFAYIQYGEDAKGGVELFDCEEDPEQFTNLSGRSEYADRQSAMAKRLDAKLAAVRANDL